MFMIKSRRSPKFALYLRDWLGWEHMLVIQLFLPFCVMVSRSNCSQVVVSSKSGVLVWKREA